VAGNQEASSEVIKRSAENLLVLRQYAKTQNVDVTTENWQKTTQNPDTVLAILAACPVDLVVDFGNAEGDNKYADLEKLLAHGASIHFKARYTQDGLVEPQDVQKCLELIRQANFSGPITLIYDKKISEWQGIEALKSSLQPLI
jgi:hypothetical protein